jgi:rhodanese-related sulfurtransferase
LISAEDMSGLIAVQQTILLDVRQPEEFASGHLANSFNVPLREVAKNLDLLPDKSASIIVICKSGGRATLAATSLEILGYENVKILKGGYNAWVGADLPTTTDVFTPEMGVAPEFDADVFAAVDNYLTNLPDGFAMISAQNLMAEVTRTPPVLIDVRSDGEWETGYINGAQHIWINDFVNQLDQLPADKATPIVVYCQSGYRGGMAAVILNVLGYTNVLNLAGGLNSWNAAGLPLVGVPLDINTVMEQYVSTLPENLNGVSPADFSALIEANPDAALVDVRTTGEFADGFIAGAVNIPLNELTQNLDLLPDLNQKILVYCGSGYRSAIAMTALGVLGYKDVTSLVGGFGAWKAAELPVSQTPVEAVVGTAPAIDSALFDKVNAFVTGIPTGYYTVRALDLSAEQMRNPSLLVDVRTDGEFAGGHIADAIDMPLRDLFSLESNLPTDMSAPIVVYGDASHSTAMSMSFLRLLGYDNVRALSGGIGAWEKASLPVVQ